MGLSGSPGNFFYARAVREHLIGVREVVVGVHVGDEGAEAAELDEEVVLLSGAELHCGEGMAYGEGVQGVLEPGVELQVALLVVPDEGFKVADPVELVAAVVVGHSLR